MKTTRSPKTKRMCPNNQCPKFAQPTSLMGGCECGSAFVAHQEAPTTVNQFNSGSTEPTDLQLENLMLALGFGMAAMLRPPHWRESALNLHSLVQRSAGGDVAANQRLGALIDMFAH